MSKKKKYVIKPRFFVVLLFFLSVVGISFYFYYDLERSRKNVINVKSNVVENENYISIFKNKIYLIFNNRLTIDVDGSMYIKKGKKIATFIEEENYSELVMLLNQILPEKIVAYYINVSPSQETLYMPEYIDNNIKYIDVVALNDMFLENYYKSTIEKKDRTIVDLLDGKNDSSYIKKIENLLSRKYGYKINTSENEVLVSYNYFYNNTLSDEKMEDILMLLNEKYIKIYMDKPLDTLASAIITIGDDKPKDFFIKIYGKKEKCNKVLKQLRESGYINVTVQNTKIDKNETILRYTAEDYYTALKLSKKIKIENLIEVSELKNIIEIYVGGE